MPVQVFSAMEEDNKKSQNIPVVQTIPSIKTQDLLLKQYQSHLSG